jgi:hypothetical protein
MITLISVVLNICSGGGGVESGRHNGLGGSNFNLHLICDTVLLYCCALEYWSCVMKRRWPIDRIVVCSSIGGSSTVVVCCITTTVGI